MPPQVRRTSVLPSGKDVKMAEFPSDDLSQIRGVPAGLAPFVVISVVDKVHVDENIVVEVKLWITGLF